MTLPTSGPLTFSQIQTEFGGTNPILMSEYYAGGKVPSGTTGKNGAIPTGGVNLISNYYGSQGTLQSGTTLKIGALPPNTTWNSIAFGNGIFLIAGQPNYATSPDGINWTLQTSPFSASTRAPKVIFGNGVFVMFMNSLGGTLAANSQDGIAYSADGINWTKTVYLPPRTVNYNWVRPFAIGGKFLITSGYVSNSSAVAVSTDCYNWSLGTSLPANRWGFGCFGNLNGTNLIIAGGDGLVCQVTSNLGTSWVNMPHALADSWQAYCIGANKAVSLTWNNVSASVGAYSTNGTTWIATSVPNGSWRSVDYGGGMYVAVGDSLTKYLTSPDGITWTVNTAASDVGNTIAFGNDRFVTYRSGSSNVLIIVP